jgi:hypothetical protein
VSDAQQPIGLHGLQSFAVVGEWGGVMLPA